MCIDVNGIECERRYAADMNAQALEEAVAKVLCDTCYGDGAWDSITRGGGVGQKVAWKAQARAAIKAVREACAAVAEASAADHDADTPGGWCAANAARHAAEKIRNQK